MSRVTAPAKQLARALNGTAASRAVSTSTLEHSTNAGATISPKYAELLRNRLSEHTDSSRGITTTHRPTPQPSLANRTKPLMQTFSSSAITRTPSAHVDAAVLPSFEFLNEAPSPLKPTVPILPDNYSLASAEAADAPLEEPQVTILAVNPDKVLSANPFGEMHRADVRFVHDGVGPQGEEQAGGMLRDLWKGMVDEVISATSAAQPKRA
ncbi:uncharacterized protein J7T54_004737 [Emericellopsis cladophorae]|uniref:Uncharacterized protein n=1 Tax=Emericellopsis cladophorae TaxID=2686198 RepID=A0A9Q0BGP3_9HYPO|nr:uncharacterized protein J7T54_004737 [Emericellopsis cladophorae]KAI6784191.1 hypothetical protein J7T54_004737 [Emericellopsis cladophorae]